LQRIIERQLRAAAKNTPDGRVDLKALVALVEQTYAEFERERRLNDRAAQLMEEELRERSNAAIAAAEEASHLKSQFLATMSHELRTPLNAVLGFAEIIRDNVFGADALDRYRAYAADIYASGAHLLSIINDILDYSKIESGSYEVQFAPVDLAAVARDSLAMVRVIMDKRGIRLDTDLPRDPCLVDGDAKLLRQILLNLLGNAAKFTPSGSRVTLRLVATDSQTLLTVCDTGVGIPPEHLAHIFDPFRQADSNHARKYDGTGLGLAIAKRLVDMHKGTITVASTPDKGTIVRVHLPESQSPAASGKRVA